MPEHSWEGKHINYLVINNKTIFINYCWAIITAFHYGESWWDNPRTKSHKDDRYNNMFINWNSSFRLNIFAIGQKNNDDYIFFYQVCLIWKRECMAGPGHWR